MGGHRRDAAPRQAPRPSWWLPATTISEQTRSPGPVCVSVRAAAAAARVRENVHSDSIAHGERARHGEREYRGRGGPAAPRRARPRRGGIAPWGAVSYRPPPVRCPNCRFILNRLFFNPSTARFAGSVASAGISPPPKPGIPSLIPPVLFECRRVGRIGSVMSVTGIRRGEGSSGGLLPSPDMPTYC